MLILLTNDDGIYAPGLVAMYRELTKLGEVHVVAPETVQSATGHGITLSTPLLTNRVTVQETFTGVAVDGRPADCVKVAAAKLLPKPPDLVVSGINSGANVGINVLYSGTVAAAIEAAFLGFPAVAVSLFLRNHIPPDYARTAVFARQVIEQMVKAGLRGGQVASINLPPLRQDEVPTGVKIVRQCARPWPDTYEERKDPRGRSYFWNSSVFTLGDTEDDTDVAALRDGYITVTPLQFDLTHYPMLHEWQGREWAVKREH
ncbi:MAG TPA: 5'/3'-nucleotidase SurE [Tepidisphaeraceae bacterium]|nr:5'/3'-nucleotidase SurE [Tepidisphaeraceae bacterium]